jgi:exodeoxyribonuclease V gamma subunit
MPLRIITSTDSCTLAASLSKKLASQYKKNPLVPPLVVIPSLTMMQWITLKIAEQEGIAANIKFKFPDRLTSMVESWYFQDSETALALDSDSLIWLLMAEMPRFLDKKEFKPVLDHIRSGQEEGFPDERLKNLKLYRLSKRIAEIFDQYMVFRKEMVLQWEKDSSQYTGNHPWQASLWNKVMKGKIHKANFLDAVRKRKIHSQAEIPSCIHLFGLNWLTPFHKDLLLFLAEKCEVLFYTKQASDAEPFSNHPALERKKIILAPLFVNGTEEKIPSPPRKDNPSLQIHSCHGPLREAEVLKDALLHLFDTVNDLSYEDIVVNVPDLDGYTPFIRAVFESTKENPLPISIAGRTPSAESPLFASFLSLLALPYARVTVDDVMAVFESPSVLEKFSVSKDDLDKIRTWIRESRIAWGWNKDDQANRFDIPGIEQNTWQWGMKRLFLSYTHLRENHDNPLESVVFSALPSGNIEDADFSALAKFDLFLDQLKKTTDRLRNAMPPKEWFKTLSGIASDFFADSREEDDAASDLETLQNLLKVFDSESDTPLSLDVAREIIAQKLQTSESGDKPLLSGITFCRPAEGRGIPAKVTVFMGMGSGLFPEVEKRNDLNLMDTSEPTDYSQTWEERAIFHEALQNTSHHFIVTYTGLNMKDNSKIPPSICIREIMEQFGPAVQLHEHKIHPFDKSYFLESAARSYSQNALNVAKMLHQPTAREKFPSFFCSPLPEPESVSRQELSLQKLLDFFADPHKFLFKERLGFVYEKEEETDSGKEPFAWDSLKSYQVRQEAVENILKGKDEQTVRLIIKKAEELSGESPVQPLGGILVEKEVAAAASFVRALLDRIGDPKSWNMRSLMIDLDVADVRLKGDVSLLAQSRKHLTVRYANMKMKDVMQVWLNHLAINSMTPGLESLAFFKDKSFSLKAYSEKNEAVSQLEKIIRRYHEGLVRPAWFFPLATLAYGEKLLETKDNEKAIQHMREYFQCTNEFSNKNYDMQKEETRLCFDNDKNEDVFDNKENLDLFTAWYEDILGDFYRRREDFHADA